MLFSFFCSLIHMGGGGGGGRSSHTPDRRPTRGGVGGSFLFHGTEIRGYSQKTRGYSPECPGGLTTSMLVHILIWRCVLDTAAKQRASKQPPLLFFYVHPHPGRGSDAPPRYTSRHCPISQRHRVSSAAEKALFSFL